MVIAVYLFLMNIIALALFGYDKRCARRGQWRVPENTLLASAAIGGSVGAWAGMNLFHHKTRKTRFRVVVVGSMVVQALLLLILLTQIA